MNITEDEEKAQNRQDFSPVFLVISRLCRLTRDSRIGQGMFPRSYFVCLKKQLSKIIDFGGVEYHQKTPFLGRRFQAQWWSFLGENGHFGQYSTISNFFLGKYFSERLMGGFRGPNGLSFHAFILSQQQFCSTLIFSGSHVRWKVRKNGSKNVQLSKSAG